MEKYVITLGDFLKNAGIVGFHYMLKCADAEEGVDFWPWGRRSDLVDQYGFCPKCGLDRYVFQGFY